MSDWRELFPDDSRVSWERRLAAEAGVDAWEIAAVYRDAWRYDNRLPAARTLEGHFLAAPLPDVDGGAVDACVAAVRSVLRSAGVDRLRLYRGHLAEPDWQVGDVVTIRDRGLSSWSPDRAIGYGHGARRKPGCVLAIEATLTQVAFAFDPASDGEVVLVGTLETTVATLVKWRST